MESDTSSRPLLSVACRYLPHDQWFTTHVDTDWKIKQVKSWLLAKCLPYAAPPSPPARQAVKKPQRPPSPITFAPDPRHRPISPITFAAPNKGQQTGRDEDADVEEEIALSPTRTPPVFSPSSDGEFENNIVTAAPPKSKKRIVLPSASTSTKGELFTQFTLLRFSTGQILEDDLPLSFYELKADELLELHRRRTLHTLPLESLLALASTVSLPPNAPAASNSRVLLARFAPQAPSIPPPNMYPLHPQSALSPIHTSPPGTTRSSSPMPSEHTSQPYPPSLPPHHHDRDPYPTYTNPGRRFDSDGSASSTSLSSPVFAHDDSGSDGARRRRMRRDRAQGMGSGNMRGRETKRKAKDNGRRWIALDMKDDHSYVSLLRVLHRYTLPASTFVESLPMTVGPSSPRSPGRDRLEDGNDDADVPAVLQHPASLAHSRRSRSAGNSLSVAQFPEWRREIASAPAERDWANLASEPEPNLTHDLSSADRVDRKGKGKARARSRSSPPDGYTSDVSGEEEDELDAYSEDDNVLENANSIHATSPLDERPGYFDSESDSETGQMASENEWVGWMGDLRRQAKVVKEAREAAKRREETMKLEDEQREMELGMSPLESSTTISAGFTAGSSTAIDSNGSLADAVVTVARIGNGVDDRLRRAAMEPSATVTSLSGINPSPPTRPPPHLLHLYGYAHPGQLYGYGNGYPVTYAHGSGHGTPVLSSPSSNESIGFSPLAPPLEIDGDDSSAQHRAPAHSRAHSHTLLHSVSMHDMQAQYALGNGYGMAHAIGTTGVDPFVRRPSMPIIGSGVRWGDGERSRGSSLERGSNSIEEVPRVSRSGSVGRSVLRKKEPSDGQTRRPRLSVSTATAPDFGRSPPGTPLVDNLPQVQFQASPAQPTKKKRVGLKRGMSIQAEKFVKRLDSTLDFVDGHSILETRTRDLVYDAFCDAANRDVTDLSSSPSKTPAMSRTSQSGLGSYKRDFSVKSPSSSPEIEWIPTPPKLSSSLPASASGSDAQMSAKEKRLRDIQNALSNRRNPTVAPPKPATVAAPPALLVKAKRPSETELPDTSAPAPQKKARVLPSGYHKANTSAHVASGSGKRSNKVFLSAEQQQILKLVQEGKSLFYTGSAGTGKSVLLREIIKTMRKSHTGPDALAITASTGIAACNIGGVTIHSFAGIGLGIESAEDLTKKIRKNKKSLTRWLRTKVLIIDEVSMLDGDLFDKLSQIGGFLRGKIAHLGAYRCFDFLRHQVWRCQTDQEFVDMLNEMRFGTLTRESELKFRSLSREIVYEDGLGPTELFPRREDVDRSNSTRMIRLATEQHSFTARDGGVIQDLNQREKLLSNFMAVKKLDIRKGAQVMLIKNMDDQLVNGSMGLVLRFVEQAIFGTDRDTEGNGESEVLGVTAGPGKKPPIPSSGVPAVKYPVVEFALANGGRRTVLVVPESFKVELPSGEVQASRTQLPLILAWAMSIHKSQGQTLERVKVDLGKVFEKGQAYVALSRATSMQGLQVLGFDASKVQAHPKVKVWSRSLETIADNS
ncbi:unnamed protein product [Mycena citricolor]|uniref:ATP-dependent DNA helicase n=1 Tax=Mycena citricolor TaxID=2018698 RepID=A0AAD2HW46_9AGAR|nr:unnamed protein product [Mycena citricolor]